MAKDLEFPVFIYSNLKLTRAIRKKDIKEIKNLINNSIVNPNKEGLLHLAIDMRDDELVKMLIEKNVDVNKCYRGKSAIELAIEKQATPIIAMLLEQGANVPYANHDEFSQAIKKILTNTNNVLFYDPKLIEKAVIKDKATNPPTKPISANSSEKKYDLHMSNKCNYHSGSTSFRIDFGDANENTLLNLFKEELENLFVNHFNNLFNKKIKQLFDRETRNYQNKNFEVKGIIDFIRDVTSLKKVKYFNIGDIDDIDADLAEKVYNSNKFLQNIFEDFNAFCNNIVNPISLKFQAMLKILPRLIVDNNYAKEIYKILPIELLEEMNALSKIFANKEIFPVHVNIEYITDENIVITKEVSSTENTGLVTPLSGETELEDYNI